MSCRIGDHRVRDKVPDSSVSDGQVCDCGKFSLSGGKWMNGGATLKGR